MARKPKEPEKDNTERWLLTYSDLMNLLLILFIIFYSISQVDKAKAEKVAADIRSGFGYVENGGTGAQDGEGSGLYGADFTPDGTDTSPAGNLSDINTGDGTSTYWTQQQWNAFKNLYNEVIQLLRQNNLEDMVDVTLDDTGVVISFKDNVLFKSGSADLGPNSVSLIDSIGSLLKDLDFSYILVEGHTDTDPIHTSRYADNMDLSTQRAGNVWRELVKIGLPPTKMASIGYGEYRPVAANDTVENKAKNRRVVITIMHNQITGPDQIVTGSAGAAPQITINPSPDIAAGAAAGG
ncbi:chemotaxis protein MotB [Sporobacter termitidis DSM 10068]|uniref:Chemotaxis protein MotB n=1 Tax=Sporobacter termitidis DSM 10068 TaxID=1123282 RepID=A0A1M5YYD5_9FIRM|nr:flagellar motor protein MotB [Sporobacter termitidis]SHI16543.1 chemotaxis protein MotB [Sporobacter termitidis DSM 10068]